MKRESPYEVMSKAPLYNPANPAKQRKPKVGHPWKRFNPGFIGSDKRD